MSTALPRTCFVGLVPLVTIAALLAVSDCSVSQDKRPGANAGREEHEIKQMISMYAKAADEADPTVASHVWCGSPEDSLINPMGRWHGVEQIMVSIAMIWAIRWGMISIRGLAGLVGLTGHVIGVDSSQTLLAECRRRSADVPFPVRLVAADAHHLPIANNLFTACRADRVLQHLRNPRQAFREMVRVVRPGGGVSVVDRDWDLVALADSHEWAPVAIAESWLGWLLNRYG